MNRTFVRIFLVFALLLQSVPSFSQAVKGKPGKDKKDDEYTAVSAWAASLVTISKKYGKGSTTVQTDAAFTALIDDIESSSKKSKIKIESKVHNVIWKDGIASIYTEPELKVNKLGALTFMRSSPFEVELTQAEAGQINKGDSFQFEGELDFHPKAWGRVGVTNKAQQLYTLRHESFMWHVGTFTTKQYQITVDGKQLQGCWDEK